MFPYWGLGNAHQCDKCFPCCQRKTLCYITFYIHIIFYVKTFFCCKSANILFTIWLLFHKYGVFRYIICYLCPFSINFSKSVNVRHEVKISLTIHCCYKCNLYLLFSNFTNYYFFHHKCHNYLFPKKVTSKAINIETTVSIRQKSYLYVKDCILIFGGIFNYY